MVVFMSEKIGFTRGPLIFTNSTRFSTRFMVPNVILSTSFEPVVAFKNKALKIRVQINTHFLSKSG
jgi:hypothetical protein